ncbi:MAG: hypothetical protein N4J56_007042 [Chroococcidiopsis sp. SAG 2025]|nr:hypothetical protein [Chroococcidiopsis sp. SAG 2025]
MIALKFLNFVELPIGLEITTGPEPRIMVVLQKISQMLYVVL